MRLVVALGGNALGKTPDEQLSLVKKTATSLVDLIEEGHELVISHGNGPQVGMINLGMEFANLNGCSTPSIPFPECGAMSQGYIGYHLQQAILNELGLRNIKKNCISVITQVVVDKNDSGFNNPTKPIGNFYTKEEALKIEKEKGYTFVEDAGRGYRRVVASPKPKEIVEIEAIKDLVNNGNIVIASGGGGIPVIEKDNLLEGIPAVIDKDFSSELLAEQIGADKLIILTAVDQVSINFNKENEEKLSTLNIEEIDRYIKEEQFAKGSMLPKIEACKLFVLNTNKQAVITSLLSAKDALNGKSGTLIKLS